MHTHSFVRSAAVVLAVAACGVSQVSAGDSAVLQNGETYLPWTVGTPNPIRFAPAIVLSMTTAEPEKVQAEYEKWKAAGLWSWIDTKRKHKCVLYDEGFKFRQFYTDANKRPKDPTDPNDPGYAFDKLDAIFAIDAIQKDGCRWMVKLDAAPWAGGPPKWMQRGDGVIDNEDNGLGGAFPLVHGRGTKPYRVDAAKAAEMQRTVRRRMIAWHRKYVQREMGHFAQAFAKRYHDNKYLYALMVGELPTGRRLPPDFLSESEPGKPIANFSARAAECFYARSTEWIADLAKRMPNTLVLVANMGGKQFQRTLVKQPNIGFGCADCRCFRFGKDGPYYPDRPHLEATGCYAPAQEWSACAQDPPGGHRAVYFMSQQYNGWVLRKIQAGVAGTNNIYGLAEGTRAPKGQLRAEHYLAYLAGPPRNPGAKPHLNNVPGVLPCQWIIIAEGGVKEPYKTMEHWKAAFEDLGAGGIGAVPAEPWDWESQVVGR